VPDAKITDSTTEKDYMGFSYTELLKYKDEASMGYMKMKMYDPPKEATWGCHNDRIVNEDWVAELVTKFSVKALPGALLAIASLVNFWSSG
jgi:hypothetical protein